MILNVVCLLEEVTVMSIRNYTSIRLLEMLGNYVAYFSQVSSWKCVPRANRNINQSEPKGLKEERDLDSAVPNCFSEIYPPEVGWNMIMFLCSGNNNAVHWLSLEGRWKLMNYSGFDIRQWRWNASFTWRRYNVNTEIHTQSIWRTIMEMRYYYMRFFLSFPIKETTNWG